MTDPKHGDPLVSCLMVTKPDRFAFAERSIGDFVRQTYPARELVIVSSASSPADRHRIAGHVAAQARSDIRLVFIPEQMTLGAARNHSVVEARGEFICQWDDDDLHHPSRIAVQMNALRGSGRQACYLGDVFHYLVDAATLSWGNWEGTDGGVHPGTLLAGAATELRYPESGPEAIVGEDMVVLRDLWRRGGFATVAGQPHLFVYVAHGRNSWPGSHHRMLAEGLSVSRATLLEREADIRAGLRAFGLPDELAVRGSDGPAFSLGRPVGMAGNGPARLGLSARTGGGGPATGAKPTVLLAQEFGSNFGHVRRLIAVAEALGPARFAVAVPHGDVVRDIVVGALGPGVEIVGDVRFRAPGLTRTESTGDCTLADVFHHVGYGHVDALHRAADRWRRLIDRVGPDLIVSEFAPTLRLASWDRVPTVVMGGSYEMPPRGGHLPTVVPAGQAPGATSLQREQILLDAAQEVRRRLGGPPLGVFGDLFQGERVFCIAPPGCDPYANTRREPSFLPFPAPDIRRPLPPFSERTGPDVFCFLWSDHPWLDLILTALNGLPRRSEIHIRGVDPQRLVAQCAPQVGIRPASADFATLLPQSRVFLHYGGAAASYAALLAGAVQVIIPIHLEQEMTARGMIANGGSIGLVLDKAATPERLREIIAAALDDATLQASALAAAERAWATRTPDALPQIVAACRDLMSRSRASARAPDLGNAAPSFSRPTE